MSLVLIPLFHMLRRALDPQAGMELALSLPFSSSREFSGWQTEASPLQIHLFSLLDDYIGADSDKEKLAQNPEANNTPGYLNSKPRINYISH